MKPRSIHGGLELLLNSTNYEHSRDLVHDYHIEVSPQITKAENKFQTHVLSSRYVLFLIINTQCSISRTPNFRLHLTDTLCTLYVAAVLLLHVTREIRQRNMTAVGPKSTTAGARYIA